MTCWLGWTWSRKLAERQQGRDFIMNKMQTVLLIMYQSRIIIRLLTPKGLLKRLLKLCIKDIKRVLRRLLLLTVFIPWKAQCACLCGCPSALVSMPAKLDHTILSFNSTEIFSNCFIGCWLKKKKKANSSFVSGFSMDALTSLRETWQAFCRRGYWPGAERALSILAILLAAQKGLRAQQRWCGSLNFMPQHLPVAMCGQIITQEPFVLLSIIKNISVIASYPQIGEVQTWPGGISIFCVQLGWNREFNLQ